MAHRTTLFGELQRLIPGHVFEKLERKHKAGRASRKFGFKEQFTVIAFFMLSACSTMREGIRNLYSIPSRLYHWGLAKVTRSTFSDAINKRSCAFFEDLFSEMYKLCAKSAPKKPFKFNCKLYSFDSTTISLCLSLFPWATFRRRKGGIKMHTLLDHDGCIPAFVEISDARTHDSKMAQALKLQKGSIVACDRGYVSFAWFHSLCEQGIFFVTRLKKNIKFKLLERSPVMGDTGVTSDHIIEIQNKNQKMLLRKIGFIAPDTGNFMYFLTNNFQLEAQVIASIYKERWKIELFFKEIKQSLKIKHFFGDSENAVRTQIFTALTIYLLLSWQKFLSRTGWSIFQILQLIKGKLLENMSMLDLLSPEQKKKDFCNDTEWLYLIP